MLQRTLPQTGKYYSVTLDGSSSIDIKFKSINIYNTYKDIIFQNYDRNPFVQKKEVNNGTIEYRFKFRGEEICISLYPSTDLYTDICVNGNEELTWWYEATGVLDKQYERLHSGELQIQGAKTGENKKPLVSEEELYHYFAIPNVYDTYDFKWPRSTILLYKYSSNATIKYWDIPENTWKRIDNKPEQHAEFIMKEDLEKIQDYLTIQPDDNEGSYKAIHSVEVILSYSPCYNCAQALCQVKEKLDEKLKQSKTRNKDIDIALGKLSVLSLTTEIEEEEQTKFKITFSNFYNHLKQNSDGIRENIEGLKNLMKKEIKLDVFTDDNWEYFFNAAGLVTKRQKRQRDDKKILQYLEGLVTYEMMPTALKAMKEDLRKNKLL